jgi:hypothetical protein
LFCRCLEGRTAARLWPLDSPSRMGSAKRRERGREGGKEGEIIVCASVLCSGFYDLVQFSSVQFSTVHYGTVQFSTVQYSTVQFSSVQFSSVQFSSVQLRFSHLHGFLQVHLVPFPQPVQQLLRNIVVANDVIKSEEEQKRRNGTERDTAGGVGEWTGMCDSWCCKRGVIDERRYKNDRKRERSGKNEGGVSCCLPSLLFPSLHMILLHFTWTACTSRPTVGPRCSPHSPLLRLCRDSRTWKGVREEDKGYEEWEEEG